MKKKIKIFFLFLIMLFTMMWTFNILLEKNFTLTSEEFLDVLLIDPSIGNNTNTKKEIMLKATEVLSGIKLDDFSSFIFQNKQYNDTTESVINISEPINIKINEPLIYIYNTHQQEQYDAGNLKDYNIVPTVLTASYIMEEAFKKNKIPVVVEETDIIKEMKKRKYSYSKTYSISRELIKKNSKDYPSIKYFFDIHRDSVSRKVSTIEIDDKMYARPMFVIGMNNKNYKKNLELMQKLETKLDEKYPNLSRGIYKRNEIYNQDLSPNAILIEVGGISNSIEEVYNTCYVLVEVFVNYLEEIYD